jgi:hypothetical protein
LIPIPLGSSVSFLHHNDINSANFNFEGTKTSGEKSKESLINSAFMYLNAPYLWVVKLPLVSIALVLQMVYKLNGFHLLRDASQQSTQGEALSFIEESEPGDLAFFDNEEGTIIHVGIIMADNYIIHASGKVRIDRIDHLGIFNAETNKHTHKLRVIKKFLKKNLSKFRQVFFFITKQIFTASLLMLCILQSFLRHCKHLVKFY